MSLVWTPELFDKNNDNLNKENTQFLSEVCENQIIEIIGSIGTPAELLRMAEMGFTPHTLIKVIKNDRRNPLVIQARNVKLMIARKLAQTIIIA